MSPKDFDQFKDQVHRLMSDFFKDVKPLAYQPDRSFSPPMDIYENEEQLVVVMEIAGMKGEDIQVIFEKDTLSISGRRSEPASPPKTRLHQMEIDYGYFARTLRIPFPVRTEAIKAAYRDGFLMVTVPKKKEPISMTVEVKAP